jgi:hypothetical protein
LIQFLTFSSRNLVANSATDKDEIGGGGGSVGLDKDDGMDGNG